jgi:hypothetical protein
MIFICNCGTGQGVGADKDVNWQYIFDGKTLTGWVQRGGKACYQVEDGAIVGTAVANTPNSFLCTEKHYSDFILEPEFKVDAGLNSGVQIRSNSIAEYKDGRVHGYQVEIDPSVKPYTKQPRNLLADGSFAPVGEPRRWTGGIYDEGRRGWLYNLTKNEKARRAFKQGQWNHFHIEAIGDSIKSRLNGIQAADLTDSMTDSGFIGLQVHHTKSTERFSVRWRNIRIKDLGRD